MSRKAGRPVAALIAGMAVAASMVATGATANAAPLRGPAARAAVADCGAGPALIRPRQMVLTCADDGEVATRLHWLKWTSTRATATGSVAWRTGTAARASSRHWRSARAEFTLSGAVSGRGGKVLFTRLRLHVTGSTPAGFMRNLTFDETPVPASPQAPSRAAKPPRRAAQGAAAPSGAMSYAAIEGYWIDAGGPSSTASTAAAITGAESSYYPGIIQQGVDYCGSGSDRAGWGLWQITCGNSVPAYGTDFQILDPWNNAEAAVSKYDAAGGFSPWSTYTSGAYLNYLQNAAPNPFQRDTGEYTQVGSTPPGTPSSPAASPGSTYGPAMQYNFMNYNSSFCLDANSTGYPSNGDALQLWSCNNHSEQQWYYDSSTHQIVNAAGGFCLDANSTGYPSNGDTIQLWSCNTHNEQQWNPVAATGPDGKTHYQIQNVANPGYCLDFNSANYPSNGDALQLWSCDTHAEQLWF